MENVQEVHCNYRAGSRYNWVCSLEAEDDSTTVEVNHAHFAPGLIDNTVKFSRKNTVDEVIEFNKGAECTTELDGEMHALMCEQQGGSSLDESFEAEDHGDHEQGEEEPPLFHGEERQESPDGNNRSSSSNDDNPWGFDNNEERSFGTTD